MDLARELKKALEHQGDSNTNRNPSDLQRLDKRKSWKSEDKRKSSKLQYC